MSKEFIKCHDISFGYPTSPEPLFKHLSLHLSPGWTGVAGANGTGKTTLLKLLTGELKPDEGNLEKPPQGLLYCPQRTDHMPADFEEFMYDFEERASFLKSCLQLEYDWLERWSTLSHGERKRVQLGVALWREPAVLAIDEPTNHLDRQARGFAADALRSYRGIGLLVSHDRELLDLLCTQCLFIEPPEVITRPGGYSKAAGVIHAEREAREKQHLQDKQAFKKVNKEMTRRREKAGQSDKRRSKRGLGMKDHDARSKKDLARVSGKDGVDGKLKRQLEGRLDQAREKMNGLKAKKEYTLGIHFTAAPSKRDHLFFLPPSSLPLGEDKHLHFPELSMKPGARVALTGPNGTGKSTLLRHIAATLTLTPDRLTYVPQEVSLETSAQLLQQVKELPREKLGGLMTVISRLGSRPQRLLSSIAPSPGETRKLLLALGIIREPHLIIMDEPTNHMDLPSVECLETALAECPCGLLLVSHDRLFLDKLTGEEWEIRKDNARETKGYFLLRG